MYEITDQIYHDICLRLGPIVMYTLSGNFFWNQETQQFETLNGYLGIHWQASYILGCLDAWLIGATILDKVNERELPESDTYRSTDTNRMLVILSGTMIEFVMISALAFGWVQLKRKPMFPFTLNRIFWLDQKFKKVFQKLLSQKTSKSDRRNKGELLVRFICIVPSFAPFIFVVSLFHPADPVHNLLKDVFEIKFKFSFFIVSFSVVLFWAVFLIVGIFINFAIIFALYVYLTGFWLTSIMPKFKSCYNFKSNTYHLKTYNGTVMQQEDFIWVYRSLQCVNAQVNEIIWNTCVTFHSTGILIAVVVSSFALIRFSDSMIDGTMIGLSLFLVLLGITTLCIILYSVECHFLGQIEDICKKYRSNILNISKRNSVLYKTAKSFQLLSLKTGGGYFNVNRSTFLEWCDQIILKLVNALVTFK